MDGPELINSLVAQWPVLSGLVLFAIAFWKVFGKYVEESKSLLEASKSLSEQRVIEANRLRQLNDTLEKDRKDQSLQFIELKERFVTISAENATLKRLIVALEEMVRASGGDIKVIAKKVEANSEELKDISAALLALPPPRH